MGIAFVIVSIETNGTDGLFVNEADDSLGNAEVNIYGQTNPQNST